MRLSLIHICDLPVGADGVLQQAGCLELGEHLNTIGDHGHDLGDHTVVDVYKRQAGGCSRRCKRAALPAVSESSGAEQSAPRCV